MSIEHNLKIIREKIQDAEKKSGRKTGSTRVLAVSKKFSASAILGLFQLGHRTFAENYVQEFLPKQVELSDKKIEWHFIGHLQTNKVKMIANKFEYIHSVDSFKIASEIAKRTVPAKQKILIEVNLANEDSKSGVTTAMLPTLIEQSQKLDGLQVCGLMFMPPLELSAGEQNRYYESARSVHQKMMPSMSAPHSLVELSMGTSHDYETAIEYGATMIRLGTALFGERDYGSS